MFCSPALIVEIKAVIPVKRNYNFTSCEQDMFENLLEIIVIPALSTIKT